MFVTRRGLLKDSLTNGAGRVPARAPGTALKRTAALIGGVIFAVCVSQACAQAQTRILTGFPPGGAVDALARIFAERLSDALGRPLIVETRAGAGGQIAAQALKAAAPDGNTLMVAPDTLITLYPHTVAKPAFDTLADFLPVAHLGDYPFGLAVGAGVPASDLKEFVAWAKRARGSTNYGGGGVGTTAHFLGLMIGGSTGAAMAHVPYKGVGPALTDLVAGHLPVVILPLGTLLPQAASGKLRILAHSGGRRSSAAPDIPTFKELGYPAVEASGWFGLFAPARTPAEIVNRYNDIVIQATRSAATRERLRKLDLETREVQPAEMAAALKADYDRWGPIVKSSGFSADSH
jgi:tripartite-type tricarboxylate transporter receptor subunit TctC